MLYKLLQSYPFFYAILYHKPQQSTGRKSLFQKPDFNIEWNNLSKKSTSV
jgi:hypothetical protein